MEYTTQRHSLTVSARKQFGIFLLLNILMLFLVVSGCLAQIPSPITTVGTGMPSMQPSGVNGLAGTLIDASVDYRLAAGDTVEIQIEDAQELNGQWRIATNGTFEMPVLGAIAAQGKTTIELSRYLVEVLKQQDYLKKPQVKIAVRQYSNQYFFIQGAVRTPGVFPMEGRPSLVKLIGLAGGLTDNYGPTAYILRPKKTKASDNSAAAVSEIGSGGQSVAKSEATSVADETEEDYDFLKVNLTPIFQFGKMDQNLRLEPGDVVNIPPARMFFVAGEVRAPGSFQLKEGTTLRQAIALAQGTTMNAAQSRGVIFRDDPETGKRQEIPVDINAVMHGKKDDLVILPNDIVIVPNSRTKTFGNALLNAFGMSTARIPMRY